MNNYVSLKWKKLEEMDKFLEMYNLTSLKHEKIENLNAPINQ